MAASDWLESMNDVRLKPKLLRSLIRNNVPDEKRPFPDMSRLSAVLSCVKTHGLLKESLHGPSADAKTMESWKSAVDAWVDHSLSLVSSKTPDKRWAGICLLGLTCQECGSDRFLASYPVWFQKLLSNIQPPSPSDSHLVKEATCASLSDLFTRLAEILDEKKDAVSEISNVKKDAVSIAGKVIQPIMQLLREGGTDAMWLRAIDLFCTLITSFPSSIQRHYERVEAIVVSKIMSGECSGNRSKVMLKRIALCLSLLPKVRGDENSCSLMVEKLLISINAHLDEPFQGLEEDAKSSEKIMRQLVPPGKDPPPPLGGQSIPGESSWKTTNRLQELVVPRVSTMMQCCCMLLTNHYPVQVTIPARLLSALLALVRRVLMVDGSLRESLSPITTAMHQEHLCSELPVLHLNSLDLLIAVIKGFHSHLLPHEANVARLIMNYFSKATLPCLRIKVYTVVHILLISKGAGMAIYLSQEVINNVFADLNFRSHANGSGFSILHSPKATSEVLHRCSHTKRKHASGPSEEHQNGMNVVVDNVNKKAIVPLSVQIAALGALNALINVGGSLKPEYWRSDVDLLLITVATNACDSGWAKEENSDIMTEVPSSEGNFQLAALKALLTSLLSPSHVRPPYLSQGLELFRKGKQVTGTNIATFCAHALLALEVLIHPRALPIVNSPASKSSNIDNGFCHHLSENIFPSSQNSSDLYNNWLGDGVEIEVDVNNREKHMEGVEQPVGVAREDYFVVSACELEAVEGNEEPIYNVDVEMACESRDENISAKIINNFVGNDMGTPGEDAAFSGDAITSVPDLNKDVITSTEVVYENENGTSSYDSDSPTLYSLLDSLPDPDSESE